MNRETNYLKDFMSLPLARPNEETVGVALVMETQPKTMEVMNLADKEGVYHE